jgi:lipoprotein Spr
LDLRNFSYLIALLFLFTACGSTRRAVSRSAKESAVQISAPTAGYTTNNTNQFNKKDEPLPEMPERKSAPKIVLLNPFSIENSDAMQFKYAIKMGVEVERLINTDLYRFIENWWGTPYRMGGATQKGVDCSAFTQTLMFAIYGVSLPRTAREQKSYCNTININDLKEGDMVFFNTSRKANAITHVGIYLQQDMFVHASSSSGVIISSLNEAYWNKRFKGAGRIIDEKNWGTNATADNFKNR